MTGRKPPVCDFRYYIYGEYESGELFFLTTALNHEGAQSFADGHHRLFPNRFRYYKVTVGPDIKGAIIILDPEEEKQ